MLGQSHSGDPRKSIEVATVAELNEYPGALRAWGMRITVVADGATRVLVKGLSDNDKTNNDNFLIEGSASNSTNTNVFSKSRSYVFPSSLAANHPVEDVNNGPNNATYHVEATVVVMDVDGSTGGSTVIAGTFIKDNNGDITQVGATQVPYAAQENIVGAFSASFTIAPSNVLSCVNSNAGVDCVSHISFRVVNIINNIA